MKGWKLGRGIPFKPVLVLKNLLFLKPLVPGLERFFKPMAITKLSKVVGQLALGMKANCFTRSDLQGSEMMTV